MHNIIENIKEEADRIKLEKGRILLFHGSKSGLKGQIRPISREKCDFGKGFYMGTIPEQPLTLICDYEDAKFYIVSIDMNELNALEIKPNIDWAMLVAFHRGRLEDIKGTKFYRKYENYSDDSDVIIGSIANDRMFFVLDNFFQGNVTDQALIQSLSALQLGSQYVAVTEKSCNKIRIEKEIKLSTLERKYLQDISQQNRMKGISMANNICKKHRRDGLFFDEIIAAAGKDA